jgi:hypothetical protein
VLSEDNLISAADSVAAVPNNETVLKTFLSVARQKGYEMATHHIADLLGPEVVVALTDISICEESTEKTPEDIETEFSSFAKDEPDGQAILAVAQSDLNLMWMIR